MFSVSKRKVGAVVTAATLLVGGSLVGASPALAGTVSPMAVYEAGGSITCASFQRMYIRVSLPQPGTITYFVSGNRITTTYASLHFESFANTGKEMNWRIESDTPISEVADGCFS